MCQLGDEVRKKEGKLDSTGLTSQNFLFFQISNYYISLYIYNNGQYSNG